MLHIYTGEGKGKTTAALGALIRAYGAGLSCAIIFFDKNRELCSEFGALRELGIQAHIFGINRVEENGFRFQNSDADILEARKALDRAWELLSGRVDVLILDEFLNALRVNLMPLEEGLKLVDAFPREKHLILTGRGVVEEIRSRADLISEIQNIKHPFQEGIPAKKGIDF
ncbi:MAG: cob(I)yrinic acid a,c-diamide adenosyltransferase [Patescibacteria group bacterium]